MGAFKCKRKLQRPDSALAELFTDASLRKWRESINLPAPDFKPPPGFLQMAEKVILPGDSCSACKFRKKTLDALLKPLVSLVSITFRSYLSFLVKISFAF